MFCSYASRSAMAWKMASSAMTIRPGNSRA
jgi:hypothetical protein